MQITAEIRGDRYQLQLQGRLDANWADHLGKALESAIRQGHRELELDFAQVGYISSAGIRVLLKYYRQLKAARGNLRVVRPTDPVLSVLRLSGLEGILLTPTSQPDLAEPVKAAETAEVDPGLSPWRRSGVEFESYGLCPVSPMRGQTWGYPEALGRGELSATASHQLRCTPDVLAVGIGAFGLRPEDTEGRFGEAMAVGGVALALPTDGSSLPDYQATEGDLVPELNLLYGLTARGSYSRLIRFEAGRSQRGIIGLSELV